MNAHIISSGIRAGTIYLVNTKEVTFALEWELHLTWKKVSRHTDLLVSMDISTVGGKLECMIFSWLKIVSYEISYWMDRLFQ